jgi:hypothetical protein
MFITNTNRPILSMPGANSNNVLVDARHSIKYFTQQPLLSAGGPAGARGGAESTVIIRGLSVALPLKEFDAAISSLMTSVNSKLVQCRWYALLKTTSQRHCISNVRHDPGYSAGLNTVWL